MLNPNDPKQTVPTLTQSQADKLIKYSFQGQLFPHHSRNKKRKQDRLIIEVGGMPNSYKSTLILSSVVNFRTKSISAGRIRERPLDLDKQKYPLHYTLGISLNAMVKLLENKQPQQVTIIDRGIYDRLAFLYTYKQQGKITQRDFRIASQYLINIFAQYIDALIICHASPQTSLERDHPRKQPAPIINQEFLSSLYLGYQKTLPLLADIRDQVGLGKIPFPVIELNSNLKWPNYANKFLKTTGYLYRAKINN